MNPSNFPLPFQKHLSIENEVLRHGGRIPYRYIKECQSLIVASAAAASSDAAINPAASPALELPVAVAPPLAAADAPALPVAPAQSDRDSARALPALSSSGGRMRRPSAIGTAAAEYARAEADANPRGARAARGSGSSGTGMLTGPLAGKKFLPVGILIVAETPKHTAWLEYEQLGKFIITFNRSSFVFFCQW